MIIVNEEFDWDAFMRDTLEASVEATGAWLRCLYKMRLSATKGRLSMPISSYARLFGLSAAQAKTVITEIKQLGIGDTVTERNGNITLVNRRMYRIWKAQEANRLRQLRFRNNQEPKNIKENNASITPMSQTPHISFKKEEVNTKSFKTKKYVEDVFTYWQSWLSHPSAKLTKERKVLIEARLSEGYSVEDLKKAVNGCKASAYHMGQNDQGKVYDDMTLIFRNGSKVEQFIGYLSVKGNNGNGASQRKPDVGKFDPAAPEVETKTEYCPKCETEFCFGHPLEVV